MHACLTVQDIVSLLLKSGADVNYRGSLGTTALFQAILRRSEESVALLLKAGADVNASNVNGTTALGYAACRGCAKQIHMFIKKYVGSDQRLDQSRS